MQCNARRDLFTSLVGTVPLADGKVQLSLCVCWKYMDDSI